MGQGHGNGARSSVETSLPTSAEDADERKSARRMCRSRHVPYGAILAGIPLVYIAWVVASRMLGLDVIFTSRAAMLTAAPILVAAIFSPLLRRAPKDARWRGYVVQWFTIALFFNVVWQAPPVVLGPLFAGAERTQDNLPVFALWWGYHSSDLDYGGMTRFWVLAEVSWWAVSALVIAALAWLWRGREARAFALLGVCGALQLYNVLFFIGYGGIVEGFGNVAGDSVLAPVIYWVFNLLWGVAGLTASILSFACLSRVRGRP